MLATFVIALREGLEAALIVGIIAAFLKRNGRSLRAMWAGVGAALTLSVAVGVGLKVVESNLPQRAQEGLETIIGVIAIVFVTGMVLWMRTNARGLKSELEGAATSALADGTTRALALMAFLAVLKEGFETAVFMLATFQAATNVGAAATGALLGVIVAVALGLGIYRGGVRLNLTKFFTYTGIFLVLVAAGLVVTALRTAYEAGWLNIGQQETFDLSALAQGGTVRGALLTGVLGIPAKPRLIEVFGWCAYLIPMAIYLYLPKHLRPSPQGSLYLLRGGALAATVTAAVLFFAVPAPNVEVSDSAPLTPAGSLTLSGTTLTSPTGVTHLNAQGTEAHAGVNAMLSGHDETSSSHTLPGTLDATAVARLNGGRLPFGVNITSSPGPFRASQTEQKHTSVWAVDGGILDATQTVTKVVTLSGGGLSTPRSFTVAPGQSLPGASGSTGWHVAQPYVTKTARAIAAQPAQEARHTFWGRFIPAVLVVVAAVLALGSLRLHRRITRQNTTSYAANSTAALS